MILGIDLGSSVFKTDVFDLTLRHVGRGSAPVVYAPPRGAEVEMPVAENEDALRTAITAALSSAGCAATDLDAISLTSQAQTFTIRSSEGRAKLPFISWRDTRCERAHTAARRLTHFAEHCSVADCMPHLTVAKLAYLREQAPALFPDPGDLLLWLPTWFVLELTDHAVIDSNLAAMSGLYSLKSGGWWTEALALCGLAPQNLPSLRDLGGIAATTGQGGKKFGLASGTPVVLAGNDQTAGAYGAAIHETDSILISLGTAQVVYASLPDMPRPVSGMMRGPYPGGRFYQLGADGFGSGTVNWARTVLPGCISEQAFDHAATSAPVDCHGVQFVADGPAGTGRWTGLDHSEATVADQARSVFVTLTQRLGEMLDRLRLDVHSHPVLLCGGGSASEPWRLCLTHQLNLRFSRQSAASPTLGAAQIARDVLFAKPHQE